MRSSTLLFCPQCVSVTHHATQGRYDHWGHLSGTTDKCLRCGNEVTVGTGHEAPAADPPPVTACLSDTEIARCLYQRHRVETGSLNEGPGEAWDATPGVWG